MVKNRLIVFITDRGFLAPTMQTLSQVSRQNKIKSIADIAVFLIDFSDDEIEKLSFSFSDYDATFIPIRSGIFQLPDDVKFNKTHVPMSTLARLSIGPLLPDQYDHIVYLDGDTYVVGDLYPLISHETAPGYIAAANDALWLYEGDIGKYWAWARGYMNGIGIDNPIDYFNAGVLAFRRDTWIDISSRAKKFLLENSDKCLYHDQSALNAVCRGKREVLSPEWNFLTNYAELGVQDNCKISLIHFNGGQKPWHYDGAPWNGRFIATYRDFIAEWPILAPYWKSSIASTPKQRQLHGAKRAVSGVMQAIRKAQRRRRFFRYCEKMEFVA